MLDMQFDEVAVGPSDFFEALRQASQGARIRRPDWPEGVWLFVNGTLKIRKPDGVFDLIVSDGDILATDWELC